MIEARHFNPHHHVDGDVVIYARIMTDSYFNPHHREGGDWDTAKLDEIYGISIHTTAKVVTQDY